MKKVLILSRCMDIGGVEISLINFLKSFDYCKYEVTLLLQNKQGILLDDIPIEVDIKELRFDSPVYLKLVQLDMTLPGVQEIWFKMLAAKCKLGRKKNDQPFFYEALKHCSAELDDLYDLAIDYHGYGYFTTIFMCSKVKARKYATFIHDDKIDWMKNIRSVHHKIDYYLCVSKACADHIVRDYPKLKSNVKVFYNIIDVETIKKKAKEPQEEIPKEMLNVLVTVGRLEWQKGYDFLLEVASELKKQIPFKWYIVGGGSWGKRIISDINDKGLQNYVYLLGEKSNPYPYIHRADVYVQTSRHEGFGLAVCEAGILGKKVVSTDLPCIREQIENGIDGTLIKFDKHEFAMQIKKILRETNVSKMCKRTVNTEQFSHKHISAMVDKLINDAISIALILVYMGGGVYDYFDLWLESAAKNVSIDFFVFTDSKIKLDRIYENIHIIYMTLDEVKTRLDKVVGFSCKLNKPYKLCDYKPAYGLIFEDYIKKYDFWGCVDPDIIFGDIRKFLNDTTLKSYDKYSNLGHLMLFRNTIHNNRKFLCRNTGIYYTFYETAHTYSNVAFDEKGGITGLSKAGYYKTYVDYKYTADIFPDSYHFRTFYNLKSDYRCLFEYDSGKLWGYFAAHDGIEKVEFMYIHLQSRKMAMNVKENSHFIIRPYGFGEMCTIDRDEIEYSNKKKELCNLFNIREAEKVCLPLWLSCLRKIRRIIFKNTNFKE